ncbi:MAG: hypothetical protein GC139_03680 [Sideroxydans sp.]|nr:hypothetical protein [Sideroxydans sp.]
MTKPLGKKNSSLKTGWLGIRALQENQRQYIYRELSQARECFPILMKPRNGEKWSPEERAMLLRTLSELSPYLIPLVMPGGFLMLPAMAWWLDRRRKQRHDTGQ